MRLAFADGTRTEADAVIGADGVHSTVLEILFGSGEPRFTGQVGLSGDLPQPNCSAPRSTTG